MTLTTENLLQSIESVLQDLKQDIFSRFNYNLDENLTFLDLTRNLILLQNVFSDETVRLSQEAKRQQQIVQGDKQLSTQNTRIGYQNQSDKSSNDFYNVNFSCNNQERIDNKNKKFLFSHEKDSEDSQKNKKQDIFQSDSSNDQIPTSHKQLLIEYKHSVEQLKKQNKIIRTIVKESTPPQQYLKYSKRKNYQDSSDNEENKQSIHSKKQLDKGKLQSKNKDIFHKTVKTNIIQDLKIEREKANRDLDELQKQKKKELQKIDGIEKTIQRREQDQESSTKIKDQLENNKGNDQIQKKIKEKRYISKINGQICQLDKEIRQITEYIQECILQDN